MCWQKEAARQEGQEGTATPRFSKRQQTLVTAARIRWMVSCRIVTASAFASLVACNGSDAELEQKLANELIFAKTHPEVDQIDLQRLTVHAPRASVLRRATRHFCAYTLHFLFAMARIEAIAAFAVRVHSTRKGRVKLGEDGYTAQALAVYNWVICVSCVACLSCGSERRRRCVCNIGQRHVGRQRRATHSSTYSATGLLRDCRAQRTRCGVAHGRSDGGCWALAG